MRDVEVSDVQVAPDGRSVTLALGEPTKAGYVYELRLQGIKSNDDHDVVNTFLVYNVNRLLDGTADYPQFRPLPPPEPIEAVVLGDDAVTLEAEDAELRGPKVQRNNQGFTGKGFADFDGPTDEWVQWRVTPSKAGPHTLAFRYALGDGRRPLRLIVNGKAVDDAMPFVGTGGWTTWKTIGADVTLKEGENVIRLQSFGHSGPNVDHLKIAAND